MSVPSSQFSAGQPYDPSFTPSSGGQPPGGYPVTPAGATPPARRGRLAFLPEKIRPAIITVGSIALLMVIVQTINWATSNRLVGYGIEPRSWSGLWGVLTAPLLHGSWSHLLSNLVPLLVLGILIMLGSVRQFVAVTVVVWLVSGLGVWLIGPSDSVTVGASGVIFGWLTYLIARGIWTRSWQHILLGLVLLALYGGVFWTGIVKIAAADVTGVVTVSWQAHLCGALGGLLAAFLVGRADSPRRPAAATA